MKKVYAIIVLVFITASIKTKQNSTNVFLSLHEKCVNSCGIKNMSCVGIIEKTIFDGKTEFDKILTQDIFSVCASYNQDITYPTGL